MKRIIYIISSALLLASCVSDLDTKPLNATDPISEYVYGNSEQAYLEGLSRLYFQFATNDLTDLQSMDGGASEIVSTFPITVPQASERRACALHRHRPSDE